MTASRFWQLEHLSDQQLLERLQHVLHTQRLTLAELVAHLGEVEERRLHLRAACGSLFSYCVQRLGMSEDEACRRIEVARLARRFPALFVGLASGGISLSVALLLKRVLSADNQLELLAAVRGVSSQRASEILAARFPRPDAPSRIRKLPECRGATSRPADASLPAQPPARVPATMCPPPKQALLAAPAPANVAAQNTVAAQPLLTAPEPTPAARLAESTPQRPQQRIEPLSAGRYRVQFTADASLKRKLEQARDLLRHAQPNGDFGAIVSRALDSLLEELMGRRFGVRKDNARAAKRAPRPARPTTLKVAPAAVAGFAAATPATSVPAIGVPAAGVPATSAADTAATLAAPSSATATALRDAAARAQAAPLDREPRAPSHIARAARRAVLERDGLGCSWVDAQGQRCGSTAWLELDHRRPAGKGGGSGPENLRMLCRSHNRFAAERAYGRAHIERAIRGRRCQSEPTPPPDPRRC